LAFSGKKAEDAAMPFSRFFIQKGKEAIAAKGHFIPKLGEMGLHQAASRIHKVNIKLPITAKWPLTGLLR
jgi:hypothetical protein